MAKNNGTWYFSFTRYHSYDKSNEVVDIRLENQDDENLALQEAKDLWEKEKQKAEEEFAKKKDWAHPPKNAFEEGPWYPALIYKVPLL
jgi:predicted ribosome quality control (RQC) complex YloA/Tae2 family protein